MDLAASSRDDFAIRCWSGWRDWRPSVRSPPGGWWCSTRSPPTPLRHPCPPADSATHISPRSLTGCGRCWSERDARSWSRTSFASRSTRSSKPLRIGGSRSSGRDATRRRCGWSAVCCCRRARRSVPSSSPHPGGACRRASRRRPRRDRGLLQPITELYSYNLITRNCASEVFATIDARSAKRRGAVRAIAPAARRGSPTAAHQLHPRASASAVAQLRHVAQRTSRRIAWSASRAGTRRLVVARRAARVEHVDVDRVPRGAVGFALPVLHRRHRRRAAVAGAVNLLVGIGDGTLGLATRQPTRAPTIRRPRGRCSACPSLPSSISAEDRLRGWNRR